MSTTHKIKGIVLRTVKYGETSVIATLYTNLFGLQSYLVKGVRKSSKQANAKINYFQPGAILDLIVYKNSLKTIQFIKEFQWHYLYDKVFFDVARNAIALYMIELILFSIKEEESHEEMFDFIEHSLILLDTSQTEEIANLPLSFSLKLAKHLGFQIHGKYSESTPYLDLEAGSFVAEPSNHAFILDKKYAEITSFINQQDELILPSNLPLNHFIRRELLKYYQQFFSLHLQSNFEMKSLRILQSILQ